MTKIKLIFLFFYDLILQTPSVLLLPIIAIFAIDFDIANNVHIMTVQRLGEMLRLWTTDKRNSFVFIKFDNDIVSVIFLKTFKILSSS